MAELILQIPPDIEEQLRENARTRQVTEENYVIELMRQDLQSYQQIPAGSGFSQEKQLKLNALRKIGQRSKRLTAGTPLLRENAVAFSYEERENRQQ